MSAGARLSPQRGAGAEIPTGNTFDKYGSANPVVRRLMAGFERAADELLRRAAPDSLLDVGCGEGILTERWARELVPGPVLGVDLDDPELAAEWAARLAPTARPDGGPPASNLAFRAMRAERLELPGDAFALVAATEVLEHLPDPEIALAELARVAARWLLVSVPREPLWRALNLARGAYVSALGNTPGHLNHFSKAGLVRRLAAHGEVVAVRTPLPWTMALVRVGG